MTDSRTTTRRPRQGAADHDDDRHAVTTSARRGPPDDVLTERRRIAGDLHDTVAQELALILRRTAAAGPLDRAAVADAARRALVDLRLVVSGLLDDDPRRTVERARARTGLRVALTGDDPAALPAATRAVVRRALAVGLANAAEHGRATAVHVRLVIQDDGCGPPPFARHRPAGRGVGLRALAGEAAALGGTSTLRPGASGGGSLEVRCTGS